MTISTEALKYSAAGSELHGHLAYDDAASGVRPGVLIIHEWWGLNDYMRERAAQIAALGYVALAVDMYGEGKIGSSPDEAGALMTTVLNDMEIGTARLQAAFDVLADHALVDNARIGATGYCFGGAMVLHMARIGMPLRAVVSFHGALGSFHKPAVGEVKAKILVCHGAADSLVPDDDVANFKLEMKDAQADLDFVAYEGALHGFTSRDASDNGKKYGLPLAYDEIADQESWQAMKDLFSQVF